MKKEKALFMTLFVLIVACTNLSCSSDDNKENEKKKLENTSWVSDETSFHSSSLVAVDKTEPNTKIEAKMNEVVGFQYTEETKTEEGYWFWDLCKQNKHECDSTITASFDANKCTFKVKVTKTKAKANQTKTENLYKFEEGSYIVRFGYNRYEEITVYSYGIYRADGTLFIPLDGKGCVAYQTKYTYSNKEVYNEDVSEYTIPANYEISNNAISFTYTKDGKNITFDGLLSADGQRIIIERNPIVSSIRVLKR